MNRRERRKHLLRTLRRGPGAVLDDIRRLITSSEITPVDHTCQLENVNAITFRLAVQRTTPHNTELIPTRNYLQKCEQHVVVRPSTKSSHAKIVHNNVTGFYVESDGHNVDDPYFHTSRMKLMDELYAMASVRTEIDS